MKSKITTEIMSDTEFWSTLSEIQKEAVRAVDIIVDNGSTPAVDLTEPEQKVYEWVVERYMEIQAERQKHQARRLAADLVPWGTMKLPDTLRLKHPDGLIVELDRSKPKELTVRLYDLASSPPLPFDAGRFYLRDLHNCPDCGTWFEFTPNQPACPKCYGGKLRADYLAKEKN